MLWALADMFSYIGALQIVFVRFILWEWFFMVKSNEIEYASSNVHSRAHMWSLGKSIQRNRLITCFVNRFAFSWIVNEIVRNLAAAIENGKWQNVKHWAYMVWAHLVSRYKSNVLHFGNGKLMRRHRCIVRNSILFGKNKISSNVSFEIYGGGGSELHHLMRTFSVSLCHLQ